MDGPTQAIKVFQFTASADDNDSDREKNRLNSKRQLNTVHMMPGVDFWGSMMVWWVTSLSICAPDLRPVG